MAERSESAEDTGAKPRRRWMLWVSGFLAVLLGGASLFYYLARPVYPYGVSHSCSKGLGLALSIYAHDHDGWYPFGMKTPEGSLSLLAIGTNDYGVRTILRGKHLPQDVVERAFTADGELGRDSCGWHYIEGLREDDPFELAILWDKKTGLDHNGRRARWIQHEVITVAGSMQYVSPERWPTFVQEQKALLAETAAKRSKESPPIRWSDEETLGANTVPPPKDSNARAD